MSQIALNLSAFVVNIFQYAGESIICLEDYSKGICEFFSFHVLAQFKVDQNFLPKLKMHTKQEKMIKNSIKKSLNLIEKKKKKKN